MDPISVAIGVAVTAIMVLVLALITKFGFGGELDYEQTIAIQKEVLLDGSKAKGHDKKKPKADKKKKIAAVRAGKAESGSAVSDEDMSDAAGTAAAEALSHPHVEYDPDPVVIEEASSKAAPSSKVPGKSILHNKSEKPLVQEVIEAEIPETDFTAKRTIPKDVVEMKRDKQPAKKTKKLKIASPAAASPPAVIEEMVTSTRASFGQSAPASPPQVLLPNKESVVEVAVAKHSSAPVSNSIAPVKKSVPSAKKPAGAKVVAGKTQTGGADLQGVLNMIQEAALSKDDTQLLVDTILARPPPTDENSWITKNARPEPLVVLRKQLEETQNALTEEKSNTQSAQAKIREQQTKLHTAEKNYSNASLQLQKMSQQAKREVQELTQASDTDKQTVKDQQEKISQLISEMEALKRLLADRDQAPQVTIQLKEMSEKLVDSQQTNIDLRSEIARYEAEKKQYACQMDELKRTCDELNGKSNGSDALIHEANAKLAEAERNARNLHEQLRAQKADFDLQLQALRTDIERHQTSSTTSPTTNGLQSNGGLKEESHAAFEKQQLKIDELMRIVADKDCQLGSLSKQLTATKNCQSELESLRQTTASDNNKHKTLQTQLSTLQAEVEKLKAKNNDLVRKNWSLNDSLEAAETAALVAQASSQQRQEYQRIQQSEAAAEKRSEQLQHRLNELESRLASESGNSNVVTSLQNELDSLKSQLASKESAIASLENSIQAQKLAHSELENRLAKEHDTRDSLQSQLDSLQMQLSDKTSIITQLQSSLHDEQQKYASMSCTSASKLTQLEEEKSDTSQQLRESQQHAQGLEARLHELSSQSSCSDDQTSVTQYKAALTAVDLMLDNLGSKVDAEHKSWAQKLSAKDSELSQVKNTLQDALRQIEGGRIAAQKLAEAEQAAAEEAEKNSRLSSQLDEASLSLAELKKSLAEQVSELTNEHSRLESSLKDEQLKNRHLAQQLAAAMAVSGAGDESGTCV